jgi:hypothetical protein
MFAAARQSLRERNLTAWIPGSKTQTDGTLEDLAEHELTKAA